MPLQVCPCSYSQNQYIKLQSVIFSEDLIHYLGVLLLFVYVLVKSNRNLT